MFMKPSAQNSGSVIDDPTGIKIYQLLVVRSALKGEALGLRFKGGSVKARWAKHYGLPVRSPHSVVLARVELEINKLKQLRLKEMGNGSNT
jgi:hypothetical protein